MTAPAIFLLGTLGVGGSERKVVRIANALASEGRPVQLAWLGGADTLLTEIASDVVVSPLFRQGKYSIPALRRLIGLLRRTRPCVLVNVNFYPMVYSAPARALTGSDVRLLASINTTDLRGTRESRFMHFYAPVLRHMDTVIFGAYAQAAAWQSTFKVDAQRSKVIHNGVDTDYFQPPSPAVRSRIRARLGLPEAAPVVICVAQLRPEKAHGDLLEAFARCDVSTARLVLVGDGPLRDELKRQAKELGLEDRILFAGEVTDVRPFLAAADLFALSSVAVETFSNAALEASAAGLPVVLTDIGGARELVDEGASGLVVPPRNPAALATALEDLLRDQARCARMGELGRARTVAAFGFGRMLAEWVSVLWDEGGVVASRPPQQVA